MAPVVHRYHGPGGPGTRTGRPPHAGHDMTPPAIGVPHFAQTFKASSRLRPQRAAP